MDMSSRLEDVVLCVGDGTRLPLRSQSFSVVTSFETVEHIQEDEAFVGELARVLKPGGTLFLSTPNGSQSLSGGENPSNPFHVREYAPDELVVLLGKHFRHVDLRGQRTKSYYPVSPYWERDDVMGEDLRTRWKVLAWKVANRLPYRMKDGFSRLIFNRAFYPGEFDFEFSPAHVATGHVLLAICRQ
jgi:SAM-dependent methyltransferase